MKEYEFSRVLLRDMRLTCEEYVLFRTIYSCYHYGASQNFCWNDLTIEKNLNIPLSKVQSVINLLSAVGLISYDFYKLKENTYIRLCEAVDEEELLEVCALSDADEICELRKEIYSNIQEGKLC